MSDDEELTGEDLYDIIVAANVELQKLLSLLLTIYADVHALTNATIPGKNALYTLLTSNFVYLKKDVVNNYVAGKLYTSKDRIDILPDVDSNKLDSSLLLDILMKYLLSSYREGICKNCKGACCPKHDHNLRDCNKCRANGNSPSDKCWHKCRSCKKDAKECQKAICCISCNICIPCNDKNFSDDVNNILANLKPIFLTCPWYIIIASLEIAKHFRNLFGHVTIEECKEFINGKVLKEQFAKCKGPEQLQSYVTFVFQNIVNHAKVKLSELPIPSTELKDGVNKTMGNLKNIFGRNAPKYLANVWKAYNIFHEADGKFYKRLNAVESRISEMKEDVESQISETKKDVESQISESKKDVESQISETKKDVESQISVSKKDVESQISVSKKDVESQISESKKDVESQISETKEEVESRFSEMKDDIESQISESKKDVESQISETKKDVELQISESKKDVESQISESKKEVESRFSEMKEDVQLQISETKEYVESRFSEMKKDIEISEMKGQGDNNKIEKPKKMKVISYLPNSCIFKIHVQPGYQIQSLKIKCITPNCESDVIDVQQKNDALNSGDSESIYEVKDLDDKTMLLKIGTLLNRRKYKLHLQTNQREYIDEVTIPDNELCTHVTNVDGVFIVLTPLLGQNNEPLNCHQGRHGYIVKDDDKITTFISDGAKQLEMTVKEFDAFCKAYLHRNFPRNESVLVFPLIQMISDPNIERVAEIFNKLLFNRNKFRAVITNLNSKKYIQCCTATDEIVNEDLPYHNRLQVFDQTTASVLNIRVIISKKLNEDAHKEIERCVIDLKYFVSSNRHHSCSCYVIGVLAFPNLCRGDIESHFAYYYLKEPGKHMNLFYLSEEDLQDVDNLQRWWNNTYEYELKKFDDDHISKFNVDSFKDICAQSMATIALTKILPNLPTLSSNSYGQITSLLLNADQMEAIQSPSNRKMVIGNYGSGKSIVLDEIAKRRFYENLDTMVKVLILYVVWEEFSLVEMNKKVLLDNLKNNEADCSSHLTMTCGNIHKIWNDLQKNGKVKFLAFLQYFLEESGYQTVHILIDELPTDVVEVDEMKKVNELIKRHPESSITIAPQSIIIDRTISTNDGEVNRDRNCLDQIELDRFELVKVMRNSIQINAVVDASQEKLKDAETLLSVYDPSLAKVTMVTRFKANVISTVSKFKKRVFSERSRTSDSRGASNEKTIQEDHSSRLGENPSTVSQSQGSVTMPAPKFEQIAKFVDSEPTKKSTSIIKSTYSFHAIQNGNGIEDQKPTLLKLPLAVDFKSEMSAKILKELLEEVCLKSLAQTMILCSSMDEIKQVSYCLTQIPDIEFVTYIPQIQGVFPNSEERLAIFTKFSNGSCLLTESTGVKGMEAKRVIIFASEDEHFNMHNFMETISRGNVWIYILLHSPCKNEKRRTLGNIIKELEDKNLFHVRPVEMFEDYTNLDCKNDDCKNDGIYKINQVFLTHQKLKQTFNDYQLSFDVIYPVKKGVEDKRRFLFTMANEKNYSIYHEMYYKGKIWSFDDVYNLLDNKDYKTFGDLLKYNGTMLNNMRDDDNWNFLIDATFLASVEGRRSIVEYLTKQFADEIDVWAVEWNGRNAYHYAAWYDRVDVMKILLSFDRSGLNVGDNDGDTPLHRAARDNNKRIVELLLDAGADVNVVNNDGETPDRQYFVDDDTRKMIENHRTKKHIMTST